MLIILEGTDLAGKSTLAEKLFERLCADDTGRVTTLMHKGPLQRHPLEEYEQELYFYQPNADRNVICDRWHIGETIYGPLLRGRSQLDLAMLWHVSAFLKRQGAVMVHVGCDPLVLMKRFSERDDDLVKQDQLRQLHEDYITHFSMVHPCFSVNTSAAGAEGYAEAEEEVLDHIIGHAIEHEENCAIFGSVHETYVGPREPQMLLLGDRRHNDDHTYRSAFVPGAATSGNWLCKILYAMDPSAGQIGVMNACEASPQELVQSWSALGQPDVVALGRNASDACKAANIEHGAVPHPQFMRRFHNGAWIEYYDLMMRTMTNMEDKISWRP